MTSAPWQDRALDDTLDSSLTCVVEVYAESPALAEPVQLDLKTAQLSYDEQRSPYVALLGAAVTATSEALEALDERQLVRIRIDLGYIYPGRVRDVHTVARLVVDSATVERPAGQIVFDAYSDEALMFSAPWETPGPWTASTSFASAYRGLIALTAGQDAATGATIEPALAGQTFVDPGDQLTIRPDDDMRALLRDLADRVGGFAYHDGLDGWRAEVDAVNPDPIATLAPGERGLARSSQQRRDRYAWGNAQILVHRWTAADGTEREIVGRAQLLTGPHSVAEVGRKTRPAVTRTHAITQAAADHAALGLLKRAITRRRLVAVECARALWWIRPRDAVTVATPDEPAQVLTVSAVTFDLPAATMQIKTRTPED